MLDTFHSVVPFPLPVGDTRVFFNLWSKNILVQPPCHSSSIGMYDTDAAAASMEEAVDHAHSLCCFDTHLSTDHLNHICHSSSNGDVVLELVTCFLDTIMFFVIVRLTQIL